MSHDWLSVTDFGAVGDDATDNTAAFESAFNTAGVRHAVVIIPSGVYRIDGRVVVSGKHRFKILGEPGAILKATVASPGGETDIKCSFTSCSDVEVHGIIFEGHPHCSYEEDYSFDLEIIRRRFTTHLYFRQCNSVTVRHCRCLDGVTFGSPAYDVPPDVVDSKDARRWGTASRLVLAEECRAVQVSRCSYQMSELSLFYKCAQVDVSDCIGGEPALASIPFEPYRDYPFDSQQPVRIIGFGTNKVLSYQAKRAVPPRRNFGSADWELVQSIYPSGGLLTGMYACNAVSVRNNTCNPSGGWARTTSAHPPDPGQPRSDGIFVASNYCDHLTVAGNQFYYGSEHNVYLISSRHVRIVDNVSIGGDIKVKACQQVTMRGNHLGHSLHKGGASVFPSRSFAFVAEVSRSTRVQVSENSITNGRLLFMGGGGESGGYTISRNAFENNRFCRYDYNYSRKDMSGKPRRYGDIHVGSVGGKQEKHIIGDISIDDNSFFTTMSAEMFFPGVVISCYTRDVGEANRVKCKLAVRNNRFTASVDRGILLGSLPLVHVNPLTDGFAVLENNVIDAVHSYTGRMPDLSTANGRPGLESYTSCKDSSAALDHFPFPGNPNTAAGKLLLVRVRGYCTDGRHVTNAEERANLANGGEKLRDLSGHEAIGYAVLVVDCRVLAGGREIRVHKVPIDLATGVGDVGGHRYELVVTSDGNLALTQLANKQVWGKEEVPDEESWDRVFGVRAGTLYTHGRGSGIVVRFEPAS